MTSKNTPESAADVMYEMLTMLRGQLEGSGYVDKHGHPLELNKVWIDVCTSLDKVVL